MTYVGAFVTHGEDPELCLVTGKESVDARVRICKWSNGVTRTAKEGNVSVIPALEGVERLRALIVTATPKGNHDVLDGKEDLVAAAYAYISYHESGVHSTERAHIPSRHTGRLNAKAAPALMKRPHQTQRLQQLQFKEQPYPQPPKSSSKILPHEEDFIREGVITEMVATNLALTKTGHIDVLGTKVDLCRLIQIYCGTAGVSAPTKSLMLRRIREITSFLSKQNPEQTVFATPRGLMFDIKEMEP